jgi:hypothetical protein
MLAFCSPGTAVTFAEDEGNNIPFPTMLTDFVTIQVTDAVSNGGTDVSYNVYYFLSPAGFQGNQTITIKVS